MEKNAIAINELMTLEELKGSVEKEFMNFESKMLGESSSFVFKKSHDIDIYKHLYEFFVDTPEQYLTEHEIECLLRKKGSILEELHSYIVNAMVASPYATYENCSDIVNVFVENGF